MTMDKASAWRVLSSFASIRPALSCGNWLARCLARNADTVYGRAYGFSSIKNLAAYQKQVPLASFETFEPFIERVMAGERDVLFHGLPVAFETTSGSTGPIKYIPYTTESLEDFRDCLLPWLGDLVKRHGLRGSLYWSISPALRRPTRTQGGINIGLNDAAYLGDKAARAVARLSAVPFETANTEDIKEWRAVTLYFLVRAQDLSFVSVWSPLFFTRLLDALRARTGEFLNLLRRGGTLAGQTLYPDVAAAARLERFAASGGDTRLLWPKLRLVSAWADAFAAPYYAELQKLLPQAAFEGKGLLATEGAVTIPGGNGFPVPTEGCGFTEFLNPEGHPMPPEALRKNEEYRVALTTSGGLYRYVSSDVVRCEGHMGGQPLLRFTGRYKEGCDLAGEKLTEPFAAACLEGIAGFRLLIPLPGMKPGYLLMLEKAEQGLEHIRLQVETALSANPHYAYARQMGQLEPLRAALAPDALERHLASLSSGRQAVAKTPAIAPKAWWGTAALDGVALSG